jgi:hypothetical protein
MCRPASTTVQYSVTKKFIIETGLQIEPHFLHKKGKHLIKSLYLIVLDKDIISSVLVIHMHMRRFST